MAFGDLPEGMTQLAWMEMRQLCSRLRGLCWGHSHRNNLIKILCRDPSRRGKMMIAFTQFFTSQGSTSWGRLAWSKMKIDDPSWIMAWNYLVVEDILTEADRVCPELRELVCDVEKLQVLVAVGEPTLIMTALVVIWGKDLGASPDAWSVADQLLPVLTGKGKWHGEGKEGMSWLTTTILLARTSRVLRECEGPDVLGVIKELLEEVWSIMEGLLTGDKGKRRPISEVDYLHGEGGPQNIELLIADLMTLRRDCLSSLGLNRDGEGTQPASSPHRNECHILYRTLTAIRVEMACSGGTSAIQTLIEVLEERKGTSWLPIHFRANLWLEVVNLYLDSITSEASGDGSTNGIFDAAIRFISQGVQDLFPNQEPLVVKDQRPYSLTLALIRKGRVDAYDCLVAKEFLDTSLRMLESRYAMHIKAHSIKSLLDLIPPQTLGGPLPAIHVLRPVYHLLARYEAAKSLGEGLAEVGSWRPRLEERLRLAAIQLVRRHPLVGDEGALHLQYGALLLSLAHAVVGHITQSFSVAELAVVTRPLSSPGWLQLMRIDDVFGDGHEEASMRRRQVC